MIAEKEDRVIIEKYIQKASTEGKLVEKKIVIFGCTIFARDIKNALEMNELSVSEIIDNNPQKIGKKCMNLNISNPEVALSDNKEKIFVVIASKYHLEMKNQLKKLGVIEKQILDIPIGESNTNLDDSESYLENKISTFRQGIHLYENLRAKYPNPISIFLCPYPGSGDVYMACGFLDEYLKKNNINEFVLCVIGKTCEKVACLFEILNIEVLTVEEKNILLEAWVFYGTDVINLKPLLHWGWRTKKYLFSNHHTQISFTEMFKYDVFELDELAQFKHPVFETDYKYAEEMFENLGLKKGKTIVLAPYASSFISEISDEEWKKLAEKCIELGYTVCTNCYGEKEPPIQGTVPIQFPYDKAKSILEYAGTFVAIRSGLCDVISSINCKQIIIYESGFNASDIEYFGLKKMKLNMDAIEVIYQNNKLVELVLGKII